MTTVAPYLIRAYHQWMEDSGLTPHILVNCTVNGVVVPKAFIQSDKIVLNICNGAANSLVMDNDMISFKARFSGKSMSVQVPITAVLTIYAGENGEGMFLGDTESPQDKDPKGGLKILD